MKTKFAKIGSLLLALLIVFSLAGCGNKGKDSQVDEDDFFVDTEVETNSDTNTESSAEKNESGTAVGNNKVGGKSWKDILATMPSDLRGKTLVVYNWNPIQEYPGAVSVVKKFKQQTGIEIEWKTENFNTYLSKLASMVAAGSSPDVVRLRKPIPATLISLQSIDSTGFDFNDAAWDKWVMDSYTVGGKCYGLSLQNTPFSTPEFLMYNKALINKYDFEDPYTLWTKGKWDLDTFIKMCKEFKKESKEDYSVGNDWGAFYSMYGYTGPIKFDKASQSYISLLKDKDFINATQTIADMDNKDNILGSWDADEFDAGKRLFWCGGAIYARRQNAYFRNLKSSGTLCVVPYPTVEGKTSCVSFGELEAYGIANGAKNAKAAPYFLRYFLDGANYDLNAFFTNGQVLKVYNTLMASENKVWSANDEPLFYGTEKDKYTENITNVTGAQVNSIIGSYSSEIDAIVNRYNNQMKSIG